MKGVMIKVAFRRRAREVHPDFQPDSNDMERALSSRQMAQLNEAYEVLYDIERRRAYDEQLRLQGVLASKQTTATSERSRTVGHKPRNLESRTRPDVDSSVVFEFSDQLRASFHNKYPCESALSFLEG